MNLIVYDVSSRPERLHLLSQEIDIHSSSHLTTALVSSFVDRYAAMTTTNIGSRIYSAALCLPVKHLLFMGKFF